MAGGVTVFSFLFFAVYFCGEIVEKIVIRLEHWNFNFLWSYLGNWEGENKQDEGNKKVDNAEENFRNYAMASVLLQLAKSPLWFCSIFLLLGYILSYDVSWRLRLKVERCPMLVDSCRLLMLKWSQTSSNNLRLPRM